DSEIMLKYLKSVHVTYHGDAKTGLTISLSFYENPHLEYLHHSKTFRFTHQGICSGRGSEIGWMTVKNMEKEGMQLHNDMPSFFKWFAEDTQDFPHLLAEEIVLEFWLNAHKYYRIGKNLDTEELLIELGRARKIKKPEDDALSKLTTISAKLQTAEEEATKLRRSREIEYEVMLVKGEREAHKKCESLRRDIYNRRSEIKHSSFLVTFLSHYALHSTLYVE
ncbi:hypothetical protein MKW98_001409, partial [Papaver atlanticum]